jgi:hypothetical protein
MDQFLLCLSFTAMQRVPWSVWTTADNMFCSWLLQFCEVNIIVGAFHGILPQVTKSLPR